jgi:hypothetical protein
LLVSYHVITLMLSISVVSIRILTICSFLFPADLNWFVLIHIDYVNETKRLSENKRRVTEIASKVVGTVNLAPTLISGWIWKRSKTLKQWRRRYVVLSGDELSYFKQIDENMKPEVIHCAHCPVISCLSCTFCWICFGAF